MNKHFEINEIGRDFVVGDLHGCRTLLDNLLRDINFNFDKDRLFSVGDLIDRGADSMGCLRLLYETWFHSVLGNHDRFMIDTVIDGRSPNDWDMNGGTWRNCVDQEELFELADLANRSMPLSITIDTPRGLVGLCHAQPPTLDWDDTIDPSLFEIEKILWSRDRVRSSTNTPTKNIYKTYHGHTVITQTERRGNAEFIDTGAVFTGILTIKRINYK